MPRAHQVVRLLDASGGMNTAFATTQLRPNELVDIRNMHVQTRGGLERRAGYEPHNSGDTATTNPIVGLYHFRYSTGDKLVRFQDGNIEWLDGGVWTDVTSTLTISTDKDDRWVFQTFRKYMVGTNGVDQPVKWAHDGPNATNMTNVIGAGPDTIDTAATLVRHRERIVLGDVTATESAVQSRYESVIWPSTSGTLDTWTASPDGKMHIDEGDGDSITCLLDVLGYLVVFKQHSLHRVSNLGTPATQDRVRVATVGTPGPHSAIVVGPFVYFLDATGRFWVYDVRGENEDSVLELTRDKLGPITLNRFVRSRLSYAHLHYDEVRNEIYCFLTWDGGTDTNVAFVYNIATGQLQAGIAGAFSRFDWDRDWNVTAPYIDSSGNQLMLAGSTDGLVAQLNKDGVTTDNGTSFDWSWTGPQLDFDAPHLEKGIRQVDLYTLVPQTQMVTLRHLTEFQTAGTDYDVTIVGAGDTLA